MKRSIAIADRRTYAEGRLLWLVLLLGAVLVALLWATAASGATAYYSFEGTFADGSETQSLLFNTSAGIRSNEPFSLRTWQYSGGTNAAGDVISAGGFDPILRLFGGETLVAVDDDIDRAASNFDAQITWGAAAYVPPEVALPDPLRSGRYRLELATYSGSLGGRDGHWAVDLLGDAAKLTLIGFAENDGTGNSEISTLKAGNGAQVAFDGSYVLNGGKSFTFEGGADFTVADYLDIGNATGGSLIVKDLGSTLTTNTASTTHLDWGRNGGLANVVLSDQATANIQAGYIDIAGDPSSFGLLTVESDADMTINGLYVASSGGLGQVDVRGAGSTLSQNGASTLTIGSASGLPALLSISDGATFASGSANNVINPTGQIRVNNATFNAHGPLILGSTGSGMGGVLLENQGQVNSRDVTVGIATATGSLLINGYTPTIGPPATWNATGTMRIGSGLFGQGLVTVEQSGRLNVSDDLIIGAPDPAGAGKLTVQTNGKVTVDDTLSAGDYGTVELLGGEITTGSFIVDVLGGFAHTDGILNVDGGQFTMEAGVLHIDGGPGTGTPTVKLQNSAVGSVKVFAGLLDGAVNVGWEGRGRLEILSGSSLTSNAGRIASTGQNLPLSNGHALVQGHDSYWQLTGNDEWVMSPWQFSLVVGETGAGNLDILAGGQVISEGHVLIGSQGGAMQGRGTVNVDGPDSLLRVIDDDLGSAARLSVGVLSSSLASGVLTVSNNGRVEVEGGFFVEDAGGVTLKSGGEIQADSFIVHPPGQFVHEDGTLTVDGGTFDAGVFDYTIDGAAAADLPIVRLDNGATAALHRGTSVAYNRRARLEILNGSHATLQDVPGNVIVGFGEGSEGEIVVDGHSSELIAPGGIAVGNDGRGTLRIRNGGSLYVQNSTRDLIAASTRAEGLVEVTGTDLGGAPSTYTTSGELHVGSRGPGILAVSAGGHVNVLADAEIAWCAGSDGSSASVTGPGSNWTITGSLYVGGQSSMAGGSGQLTVANHGQVVAAGSVKVWQPGTVGINQGIITASNVELAGGALFGPGEIAITGGGAVLNQGVVYPQRGLQPLTIIGGDYVQGATGELRISLSGTSPFDYDRLEIVSGAASLNGNLRVEVVDTSGTGFTPWAGDTFEILRADGGLGGTKFLNAYLPPLLSADFTWRIDYGPNSVTLVVGILGDYNLNGVVDAADYTVWRDTLGSTTDLRANGDDTGASAGVIDGADYLAWKTHFGLMAGSGAARSGAVPEPATICLMTLSLLFWNAFGRRGGTLAAN